MSGSANGFDWPALMRVGMVELGLAPDVFWRLSPGELALLMGAGASPSMTRAAFDALAARFPDKDPEA